MMRFGIMAGGTLDGMELDNVPEDVSAVTVVRSIAQEGGKYTVRLEERYVNVGVDEADYIEMRFAGADVEAFGDVPEVLHENILDQFYGDDPEEPLETD
jgi:hypothetical protein